MALCAFAWQERFALPAAAQEEAVSLPNVSERVAALSAQAARGWTQKSRQLDLVVGRLNKARTKRPDGKNINTSSLAVSFIGRNGRHETKTTMLQTSDLLAPDKARQTDRLGVWFAGDVKVDSLRAGNPRLATVHTDGITFGTDARLGPNLLVGNAIGTAFDRTGVGEDGSLRSLAIADTLYASTFLSTDTYLDVAVGAAWTDFTSRYGAADAAGSRDARQLYATARYSREFRRGRLTLRPYGEAGTSQTYFGRYGEDASDLTCPSQSALFRHFSFGMRAETALDTSLGMLRPHAKFEVSRTTKRRSGATIAWSEAADAYRLSPAVEYQNTFVAQTGLKWQISDRATLDGEYRLSSGLAEFEPQQKITASFNLRF